jgi:hypothetical protein
MVEVEEKWRATLSPARESRLAWRTSRWGRLSESRSDSGNSLCRNHHELDQRPILSNLAKERVRIHSVNLRHENIQRDEIWRLIRNHFGRRKGAIGFADDIAADILARLRRGIIRAVGASSTINLRTAILIIVRWYLELD